jgi:hypothetical protein
LPEAAVVVAVLVEVAQLVVSDAQLLPLVVAEH